VFSNKRNTEMTKYKTFSTYLTERLNATGMTIPELSKQLGYKALIHVPHWFKGSSLPPVYQLRRLAELLEADPVVLSIRWLISQAPDLEEVMEREVLAARRQNLVTFGNDSARCR
jgi:hypothetical protein